MAGFPENVLLVDDDDSILEIEELALRRVGDIQIKACNSCDQALELVNGFAPDLVLLDLKMPGRDGTEVVRAFRANDDLAYTPIIFVTGEHKVRMQDDYKALGVIGVIHKPFKPSELVTHVQKHWQAHRFAPDE